VDDGGNVALLAAVDLGAVGLRHRGVALGPFAAGRLAAPADLAPAGEDRLGDLERRVGPAELFACRCDLVLAERRAVRGRRALLVGRAVADDRLAGDQRRLVGDLARLADGAGDGVRVLTIDTLHVPAGGGEAL